MKITILLSFILMNTLVFSQDYKTAIGLKGGYPGFGSLNAKHFISENSALEATFGGMAREKIWKWCFCYLRL